MSLARINIALKGVTEGQWVLAVRDANLPIRANGKYVGFVNLMKRYADLSLGLPDGKSFNLEYFRQFFQTTTDGTYAILSAKLVAYVLVVYPIVSRRSLGCAYGGRCKLGGCVFCLSLPDQVCSYPEDFLSLCVVFWDLKPTSQFSTGIGAMLAASHVRGHSCVSSLYANRVGKSAPHGVSSFEHLFHAVGASNFNDFDDGSAILKVSITSRGVGDSVHYLPCGFVPPGPLPEITVHSAKTTLMFEVLPVNAFTDKTSLNSFPTADEGLGLSPPKFCEFACGDLEPGKVFCASCGYVVKADGHQGRCANFPVVYSKTKARLGDVMHRFDVIVALSAQGIHGPAQTQLIADLVSAKEQRAFMLHGNHALESEPLATVSTRFECHYLDFRSRYLSFAFPRVPPSTFAYDFPVVNVDGSVAVGSSSTQVGSPTGGPLAGPSVSDSDSSYEDASESFVIGGASSADVENDRAEIRAKISALKAVSGDSATARDRILIYEQELRRLGKVFRSLKRSGR